MFENIRTYHKEFGIPEGTMKFVVSIFKFYRNRHYLSPKQFKAINSIYIQVESIIKKGTKLPIL